TFDDLLWVLEQAIHFPADNICLVQFRIKLKSTIEISNGLFRGRTKILTKMCSKAICYIWDPLLRSRVNMLLSNEPCWPIGLSILGVCCDPPRSFQLLVVAQSQRSDHR